MIDDKDESSGPKRPPLSPEAAAARRARRIGGRTVGQPSTAQPQGAAEPTSTAKPASTAKPKPAAKTQKAGESEPESRPAAKTKPAPAARVSTSKPAAEPKKPAAKVKPRAAADAKEDRRPGVRKPAPAWLNWAPAAVLSVGALIMAVLLIVFSHGVWWGPDPASPPKDRPPNLVREQVLAAAKSCVADANTYKYTDLETYEQKALDCTTGEFTSQLRTTIETLIKVNAPKLKSSQTAQINRGGIEAITANGRQWTILLFGQLTVTNASTPKGRTDPFAAQVRMQRVGDEWLIAALSTVSTPVG